MRFGIPHTTALARLAIATISLCLLVNACGEPSTSGVTATEPVGDAQPAEAEPEPEPEPEEPPSLSTLGETGSCPAMTEFEGEMGPYEDDRIDSP